MKYNVLLRQGNESGFVATVPALPGCISQGKTKRQALRNIREAIAVYIEALLEDGLPVPLEAGNTIVEVEPYRYAARRSIRAGGCARTPVS